MIFLLIFATVCAINRCTALDLQQQLMLQSAISYLETQFEDVSNATKLECKTALLETFQGVREQKFWALKIVDSIPKIPAGVLEGNVRDFGNYDECLSVRNEDATIHGKYCLVDVAFTDALTNELVANMTSQYDEVDMTWFNANRLNGTFGNDVGRKRVKLQWGFCVPHACDGEDITAFFDQIIYGNFKEPIARIIGESNHCETSTPPRIPLGDLLAMIAFGIVFAIAGASTVYDVLVYQKRKLKSPDFWICFSFLTNGRKLFLQKRETLMPCLNGIRSIGCVLVIVTHMYQFNWILPIVNSTTFIKDNHFSIRSIMLVGGPASVDTFLLISGMLTSYNFFKEAQTEVKTLSGIPAFYFHRIIRLLPPIIAITIYQFNVLKWQMDGPAAIPYKINDEGCLWWSPMLFFSNWTQCISHMWYLGVDMQLFLISPIFLFALMRKPKLGYALLALTFSTAMAYTIYILYVNQFSMVVADLGTTRVDVYVTKVYIATHFRMTPWLLGIAYGHFAHTQLSKRLLNHVVNIVGWFCALSIFLYYMITYHSYSVKIQGMLFMSVYSAFNRPLWALAVAFIIHSCRMGYGSLANYILSWDVFRILSNLCYSMYLLHFCIGTFVVSSRFTATYLSDRTILVDLWSTYLVTLIVSIPFALCFEYPFTAMESYFKKRGKQMEPTTDITLTTIQTINEKEN